MTWTAAAAVNPGQVPVQVNDWTNHADRGENRVDITEQNKLQGYANTVTLKAYNESSNVQGNADRLVLPIVAIEQYQIDYPAPANGSGWYVPSIMELKYMCWGQGNDESGIGQDLLNGQFAKVGGTNFSSSLYWSSSEYANAGSLAWSVDFYNCEVIDDDSYQAMNQVRSIFAF